MNVRQQCYTPIPARNATTNVLQYPSRRRIQRVVERAEDDLRKASQRFCELYQNSTHGLRVAMLRDAFTAARRGEPVDVDRLVRTVTGLRVLIPMRRAAA